MNPVVFQKMAKSWLISGRLGSKNLPLVIVYLILKYSATAGQGLMVQLKGDFKLYRPNSVPQYVFVEYQNVFKNTLMLYIPTIHQENGARGNIIIVKDSQVHIDEDGERTLKAIKRYSK